MSLFSLVSLLTLPPLISAQISLEPKVLCIPGQCLQGYSNTTIGAKLSSPSSPPSSIHLLPGQYSSTTNPQLLHDVLTSTSTTISSSAGFGKDTLSLPLDLSLPTGLATFSERLYSGQTTFTSLTNATTDSNFSVPLNAKSIAVSPNVFLVANSSSNRIILWDPIPDIEQLPSSLSSSPLALVNIQSTACSPACSSAGTCAPTGQCTCLDGFTGPSCEQCAPSHFGPRCQKCEDGCEQCDEGVSGTGRCLKRPGGNNCNCLSGVCGSDGQCQCTPGFTTADNGTQCAKCADGFFQVDTGDCKACGIGCATCSAGTGICTACQSGWSLDSNDNTRCNPPTQIDSTGKKCLDTTFSSGGNCVACALSCQSCLGDGPNACTSCAPGLFLLNGACVSANSDGICPGSELIANTIKGTCEACGARCLSCRIPNFTSTSVDKPQCTKCIPGTFLSNGQCVDSCPSGTFISPQDNMTCLPCDSSCSTCTNSASFCLTCSNPNQLASNGKCVTSCPQNTFSSSSTCLSCHPDCASCSGSQFNQCTSCPSSRPALVNGRCLPACSKNEYLDASTNTCKPCDSSCGSCSGPGSSSCLSCSNTNVLRSGSCVPSSCTSNTTVIPSLGVCLSELIILPTPSGTTSLAPLPTITGLNQPTVISKRRLEWWQILLMALGCAFIFLVFIWCCRRRSKKKKEQKRRLQGYAFENAAKLSSSKWNCWGRRKRNVDDSHPDDDIRASNANQRKGNDWRQYIIRFGQKLFGRKKSIRTYAPTVGGKPIVIISGAPYSTRSHESIKLHELQPHAEEGRLTEEHRRPSSNSKDINEDRHEQEEQDMIQLISSYRYTIKPQTPPAARINFDNNRTAHDDDHPNNSRTRLLSPSPPSQEEFEENYQRRSRSSLSTDSMYSQLTGGVRRTPEPREPVRENEDEPVLKSKFSMSTLGTSDDRRKLVKSRKPSGSFWK